MGVTVRAEHVDTKSAALRRDILLSPDTMRCTENARRLRYIERKCKPNGYNCGMVKHHETGA